MFARITTIALLLTVLSLLTACEPPQATPEQGNTPAPTPAPVSVLGLTATPTPISVPALTPTPPSVPTPTHTPAPVPSYLTDEIPPCTPISGSPVDPCEPGTEWAPTTGGDGLILFDPPLHVKNLLNSPTTPIYTTHVVLRGTYLPGTVRCTSGHRNRYPAYVGDDWYPLFIYCFADVRVNSYLLGSGPSTLTVIEEINLYALEGVDDEDYGLEQLESRRRAYERALSEGGRFEYDYPLRGYLSPGGLVGHLHIEYWPDGPVATGPPSGIGGREVVLFISPSSNLSVEAWRVRYMWEMERRDDGTVVALHPYRRWFDLETYRSMVEMELPDLTQAVTAAHQERVVANGGRIGADASLPMLVTDANQLRQYFSDPKVGGYAPGVPTPAQPPPPCGLAVPDQAANPGLMRDCMALLAAKDPLRGTATLNWSVDTPITSWEGVRVRGTPGRVHFLLLADLGLTGVIPPELGALDALRRLDLDGNELTGEIPSQLGGLSNLAHLYLFDNGLSGPMPTELGNLSDLEGLDLEDNHLTGGIPSSLGGLTSLKRLILADNELRGPIPATLGRLSELTDLWLDDNDLTGEIPATLGDLEELEALGLGGNRLTGAIPAEMANLAELHTLYLNSNQLSGPMPTGLGNLSKLEVLHVYGNELTGEIPVELGSLTKLRQLILADNELRGPIPATLGGLSKLTYLWLNDNELTGEIPAELGEIPDLEEIYVAGNSFTGCVPTSLRDVPLNDLERLDLSYCDTDDGA